MLKNFAPSDRASSRHPTEEHQGRGPWQQGKAMEGKIIIK
jgi:hypothetical protein